MPAWGPQLARTLVQLVWAQLLGSELSESFVMLTKGGLQFPDNWSEFAIRSADGLATQLTDTVFQTTAHNSKGASYSSFEKTSNRKLGLLH